MGTNFLPQYDDDGQPVQGTGMFRGILLGLIVWAFIFGCIWPAIGLRLIVDYLLQVAGIH